MDSLEDLTSTLYVYALYDYRARSYSPTLQRFLRDAVACVFGGARVFVAIIPIEAAFRRQSPGRWQSAAREASARLKHCTEEHDPALEIRTLSNESGVKHRREE